MIIDRIRNYFTTTLAETSAIEEPSGDGPTSDELASLTKQWEVTVGVQKHFNDLEWRIRSLALTALTAIVGFALSNTVASKFIRVDQLNLKVGYATFLGLVGLGIWTAFFMSDYKWYHPMLGGAGLAANELENRLAERLGIRPESMLSHQIYESSKNSAWRKGRETHSTQKLRAFYLVGYMILGAMMIWNHLDLNLPQAP